MLGLGHEPEDQVVEEPEVKCVAVLSEAMIHPSPELKQIPFWLEVAGA